LAPPQKTAVIIGAGPAGLTAALEFCRRSAIHPIVLEASDRIGGISCTIRYHGNRIDIGGHRFFSKSDRVMEWWTRLMPIHGENADGAFAIRYQNKGRLGALRTLRIGMSYIKARLMQRMPEKTLEDFLVNRFGRELYLTFFKSYTEKVWGVPCEQISAAWGAQRIRGLSLRTAVAHFVRKLFAPKKPGDIAQKDTETSLIEQFLYPKYGPGQLWEHVAELVQAAGGELRMGWRATRLNIQAMGEGQDRISSVEALSPSGETVTIEADYVFSTMPVRELLRAIDTAVPAKVQEVSDGLMYRDFLTVGLLVDRLLVTEPDGSPLKDTWIYIQEPDVLVGRLQIFNNWSPYMVADPSKIWIGLEYFLYDTDELWSKPDAEIAAFAIAEVAKIGLLNPLEVRDSCVVRVPKTYPAYFGTYDRFDEIVRYMDRFENLFLVGRNGMHKYNNQDHSMLTAMQSVDNILAGNFDKTELWEINTEQEYHESKEEETADAMRD
jgi:protoporphyrinogen oxidase